MFTPAMSDASDNDYEERSPSRHSALDRRLSCANSMMIDNRILDTSGVNTGNSAGTFTRTVCRWPWTCSVLEPREISGLPGPSLLLDIRPLSTLSGLHIRHVLD